MTTPKRVQQRRTKGWRKPEGAIAVGRGTRWGNAARIVEGGCNGPGVFVVLTPEPGPASCIYAGDDRTAAHQAAVDYFRALTKQIGHALIREHLAGRDLMCWCPLDQPCHADVLLEIANA